MLHCELKPGNIFMITEIYLYFKNIVYNILFLVTLWIFSMWELGNDTHVNKKQFCSSSHLYSSTF